MRIAVMAAGGVGSLLGALLARAGAEVTLVCRGAHLAAIHERGLRVTTPGGAFTPALTATDAPATAGPVDVVLQTAKLYDLAATAQAMRPMVGPATVVITLQNGVVAHEEVGRHVDPARVAPGTSFLSAFVNTPGTVDQKLPAVRIVYGRPAGASIEAFTALARAAGIDAVVAPDIQGELWTKFAMMAAGTSVGCLSRQSVGGVCADVELTDLFVRATREGIAVAAAKGIAVDANLPDRALAYNRSAKPTTLLSMQEDLAAGRPLELEWLQGYLVREARRLGVPVPIQETAYACLRPFAAGRAR